MVYLSNQIILLNLIPGQYSIIFIQKILILEVISQVVVVICTQHRFGISSKDRPFDYYQLAYRCIRLYHFTSMAFSLLVVTVMCSNF